MKPTFLPWWHCAAMIFDDSNEFYIDLDLELQAATAGEAEDIARAEWADHGIDVEAVKTYRLDSENVDA